MLLAFVTLLVGLGCGLRLNIFSFVGVMFAVFVGLVGTWFVGEAPGFAGGLTQVMVAALCLQIGYAGGLLFRALTD